MNKPKKTWDKLITDAMKWRGETWGDLVATTLTYQQLHAEFRDNTDSSRESFTLWTKARVYFPIGFEGGVRVHSVPRNPSSEAQWNEEVEW